MRYIKLGRLLVTLAHDIRLALGDWHDLRGENRESTVGFIHTTLDGIEDTVAKIRDLIGDK